MWPQSIVRKQRGESPEHDPSRTVDAGLENAAQEIQDLRRRASELQAAVVRETRAEDVLKESEERFRRIFEEGPLGMAMSDPTFRFVRANAALCRMLGYTEKELTSLTFKEITHPDHVNGDTESLKKLLHGDIPFYRTEKRYVRKDKEVVWGEVTVSAIHDSTGQFQYFLAMVEDITARKQANGAQLQSEQKYRELADSLPSCIFETDLDGRLTFVNRTALEWFGYTEAEFLSGVNIMQLVTEPDWQRAGERFRRIMSSGTSSSAEYTVKRKDGSILTGLVTARAITKDGQPVGLLGMLSDISERKRAEGEIRRSEEYFRSLIEKATEIITVMDMNGTRRYVSPSVERILGYKPEELVGTCGYGLVHPDDLDLPSDRENLLKALGPPGSTSPTIELRERHKDGSWRFLEVIARRIIDTNGEPSVVANARDITERKQAQLLQNAVYRISQAADKSASLDDLFKSVHDIIGTVMPASNFYIALHDTGRGLISFPYFVDEVDAPPAPVTPGKGLTEYVIRTGKPLLCDDATDQELRRRGEVEIVGAPSAVWLGVPLVAEGKTFGAMVVQHYTDPTVYGQRELRMLEFVSSQVAKSIERKQAEKNLHQSLKQLRTTLKAAIDSLASAIEMRDPYTAGHQERVTRLAAAIAAEMGLDEDRIEGIQIAGIIHDIGKLYVPAEILSKPTKLSELEYSMIKMHAQAGYKILSKIDFPWPIAQIVHQHHEAVNGSGYPLGLTGKDILLEAKILCVADVVEAMSSHRPYRPALGMQAALDEISQKRGILYDREVVDACQKLFSQKKFKFD